VDATFQNKECDIAGEKYYINLWDTAGQEKYHALNQMYYRGAAGALLVYDVTDRDSFTKIQTWHLELRKYLGAEVPIMIAGNKSDMPNFAVSKDLGENFAREVGSEHVFTSAKTGKGVEEVFRSLVTSK
jgi:small GTP-binding protein